MDKPLSFESISKADGLPSTYIKQVLQDHKGFIWVATSDGLCRYDGGQMTVLKANQENNSLEVSFISILFQDKDRNLWIGTRLGGLTRYNYDTNKWTTYKHDPQQSNSISNNEILSIYQDRKGTLWVGTEQGLNVFDFQTETFTRFIPQDADPSSLNVRAVLTIQEDLNGRLWIGTWGGGLNLFLPAENGQIKDGTFRHFSPTKSIQKDNIWKIFPVNENQIWLATFGVGICIMNIPSNASDNAKEQNWDPDFNFLENDLSNQKSIASNLVQDILIDKNENFWIATVDGLSILKKEIAKKIESGTFTADEIQFDNYKYDNKVSRSILNNNINDLYQDQQGIIWLSTYSGLSFHTPYSNQFNTYNQMADYDYTPNVRGLVVNNNNLWIGTGFEGLFSYNFETEKSFILRHNPNDKNSILHNHVNAITQKENKLYLGTAKGLSIYNIHNGEFENYPISKNIKEQIGPLHIITVLMDSKERIWLCTDKGLLLFNGKTKTYKLFNYDPNNPKGLSDNSINSICEDSDGNFWITTFNGFNRITFDDNNEIQEIERFLVDEKDAENSISSNRTTSLLKLKDIIWIGTEQGLSSYDLETKKFQNYNQSYSPYILSLINDESENIWGTTTDGIFHFDTKTKNFKTFDKEDGLNDNTYNINACTKDKNGQIYFGSRSGVTAFLPSAIKFNTTPPPVFVTEIKTIDNNGQHLSTLNQDKIDLYHKDYYLSLNFAALNYVRSSKNQLAYKLEGFDQQWTNATENQQAVYTNLDVGTYTFRVKGANNDGVWNEEGTSVKVTVHPAFWQTFWFRALMTLLFCLLVYGFIQMRTRNINENNKNLIAYNEKLNTEINERKKIEKTLKEREILLRSVMDNIPQIIFWKDKSGAYLGANSNFSKSIGLNSIDALTDLKDMDIEILRKQANFNRTQEMKVMKTKQPALNVEQHSINPETGEEKWVHKNFIPLQDENKNVIGVLCTVIDITQRKITEKFMLSHANELEKQVALRTKELGNKNVEIEQLLLQLQERNDLLEEMVTERTKELKQSNDELIQSNHDLEQFAYIASHDLQEPLRMVGNFVGILSRKYKGKLDNNADEYIDFAVQGVSRMSTLITSLLKYSRVGRRDMVFSGQDLNTIIELKVVDLSQKIKEHNAKVIIDSMPEEIFCEKEQIGMVFYNLINNAIKFNQSPEPKIHVKLETDAPPNYWKFSVTDNGIGIQKEYQEKIFEIFRRLNNRNDYEGTGIGLALCQKIITGHHGRIWVESSPGNGSTFYFTISKQLNQIEKNISYSNNNVLQDQAN